MTCWLHRDSISGHARAVSAASSSRDLLSDTKFQVERFVRVACPARGTTLASGKLDRWLSILVNLVGQIPTLKGNPIYESLTDFALAVAKERTEPKTLPGLEAMMPKSALIRLLNLPGLRVKADLSVIAGDTEGAGILGKLKLLIPDLFYGCDHDLVVNTPSMYGGAQRVGGARFFFDQGIDVSHFLYFENRRSVQKLIDGLTRAEGSDAGFTPLEVERAEVPRRAVRGPTGPRPVVFLVPGIMGTHLAVNGNRIWIDMIDLAFGGLRKLAIEAANVTPQALVSSAYGSIVDYLSNTHEVIAFPYDWRKSLRDEAHRLADEITAKLDAVEHVNQPVRILAHSMGGLLARTMIALHGDLWARICKHPGARFTMLGTPNGGFHVITQLLVGQEGLLNKLALLDIRDSAKELLVILARFPGVVEMLPADPSLDFFSAETWARMQEFEPKDCVPPTRELLNAAHEVRALLASGVAHSDRVLYVAGWAPATPIAIEFHDRPGDGKRAEFVGTARGDGRVPWSTGILPGIKTWYIPDAEHGDLANHEPSFDGILELLQNGDTTRLSLTPPVMERGVAETFPMPRDIADIHPDEEELAASAIGTHRRRPDRARAEVSLVPTQRGLVDQFIEQAVQQPVSNRETARTLFGLQQAPHELSRLSIRSSMRCVPGRAKR